MSLLMNEDLTIYQLRVGYLHNIKDGVGERLITLNPSVLNNAAFRAAGWVPDPADLKRTYSPPIPTAITSDYFQVPPRSAGFLNPEEDDEGGLVTGHGGNDTPGPVNVLQTRRRKRKEQLDEDDSSDLSDDSDDDDDKRAARQIKFSKMPMRHRSGSLPPHGSKRRDEVSLLVTSPSRPSDSDVLRRGSMGAVDAVKQRARRDTTTSSEMSSENEMEPLMFRRRQVQVRAVKQSHVLSERIQEEDFQAGDSDLEGEEVDEASDLSDDFGDVADDSLLGLGPTLAAVKTFSLDAPRMGETPLPRVRLNSSPRRTRQAPPELPRLPTGRPISYVQPVSLLSKAFKTSEQKAESPFQQFAQLSGKGDPSPLWIKIYYPFSSKPSAGLETPLRRTVKEGVSVSVAELIGLSLWQYAEDKLEPDIKDSDMNINRWTLRMVEDEEVDYDFPALGRARPVSDFTSNNNRPARGRTRDKPWDEFALVRATDEQFKDNERLTPEFNDMPPSAPRTALPTPTASRSQTPVPMQRVNSEVSAAPSFVANRNPITGPYFAPHVMRKDSSLALLDAPVTTAPSSTPRNGVPRTVTIHHLDQTSFQTALLPIPTTSDTYLAEIFTTACQRLNLDKALYVLKVRGTQTIAPHDRTVEALGERLQLDLHRRRFVGIGDTGIGAGSPGSESPNAPLHLTSDVAATTTTTRKNRKGGFGGMLTSKTAAESNPTALYTGPGKRYQVIRRQPLSFAPSNPRMLALDGEYLHIMPGAGVGGEPGLNGDRPVTAGSGKTTSVHLSSVVGCKVSRKHPKSVRVLVYREKETKRYDFEASTREEAAEIAGEIRRGVERFGGEEA